MVAKLCTQAPQVGGSKWTRSYGIFKIFVHQRHCELKKFGNLWFLSKDMETSDGEKCLDPRADRVALAKCNQESKAMK